MLQSLRKLTSSFLAKVVLGLIVFSFSFFGIESYFVSRGDTYVAKVGDREISQQDFRTRYDEFRQQQTQMMGGQVDATMFERPEMKRGVLDQMIDQQVLLNANDKLGIVVPAERLREEIANIPAFQTDGKFDPAQYRAVLASQGMSPIGFEERVRHDLAARELPSQIGITSFVTNAEVDAYLRLRDQKRDFRYVRLDKPAAEDDKVGDDEIKAYYAAHKKEFLTPERVALSYIELDASQLKVNLTPDDATLKDRYEKEKNRFVSQEQRLASHILIKVAGKGAPAEQKAALAKAEAIETQLKAGANFADLAKKDSDDLGSRAQGGDLGWLDKGTTDPAFDSALFAMKKGEISAPVLSPEGYHIIDLRDIRPGKTRSFDEVRPELVKEYQSSERERVYDEESGHLTDLTYQDPSSLEPAAKALGLTVQKTGLFSRQGGEGIAANPAVAKAAFSDTVLVQGNNSDPIDLGNNHIVVIRVAEHKPATPEPLDEVRTAITTRIIGERVARQAKTRADGLFAKLGKGGSLDAIAAESKAPVNGEKGIGRDAANLDGALVKAVFEMPRPQAGKPDTRLVSLGNDAYALVQMDGVTDGDPSKLDEKTREAARNALSQGAALETARGFISALRAKTDIKVIEKNMQ